MYRKDREQEIDEIVKKMCENTGIDSYYQEIKPDQFEVFVQKLIPKFREQVRLILEREDKKSEMEKKKSELKGREEEIDKIIKKMYEDTGIYGYYQELKPDQFEVFVQKLIPKRREQVRLILEREDKKTEIEEKKTQLDEWLEKKQKELDGWQDKLYKSKCQAESIGATLRFWEKNGTIDFGFSNRNRNININTNIGCLYLLNNSFDWFIKTGLTVVPILSLLSIFGFGINNLKGLAKEDIPLLGFILFVAVTLVWMTSVTVFNLIISLGKTKNKSSLPSKRLQFKAFDKDFDLPIPNFKPKITDSQWIIFIIIFIVIAESLVGFAIIPGLINEGRSELIETGSKGIELLSQEEKWEILVGISVFSLINVLSAVAKGRVYKSSITRKVAYAKAATEWQMAKDRVKTLYDEISNNKFSADISNLETQIQKLDEKIKNLDKEVFPEYDLKEIKESQGDVSREVVAGITYRGRHPGQFGTKAVKGSDSVKGGNSDTNEENSNIPPPQNSNPNEENSNIPPPENSDTLETNQN